jgi:hypothetical protein
MGDVGDPSSPAFTSLVGSLITALYYQLLGTPDVLGRTHGHSPYDNRNTVYTMGALVAPASVPSALIASMIAASNGTPVVPGVTRYDITPDAQNYIDRYYVPTGRLTIPVVSVHNFWDPLVPFFHEPALAQIAASAGASSMLLQRGVPNYGHCNFPTPLVVSSFQTLTNWVTTGVKPAA